MIPQLSTASSGPLADLERRILDGTAAVEHWFRGQRQEHMPPFYASVDLRNSGSELAPAWS
jgi:glutamate--cysteine ligase